MICDKCKTAMRIKAVKKNLQVYVCRNPKCSKCGKEHTKSR